jgi:heat shock protein HslJ
MKIFSYFCLALAGALLAACAASPMETPKETPVVQTPSHADMPASPASFHESVWRWRDTVTPEGKVVRPDNPERYTIQFLADGRLAIVADCNRGNGPYTVEKNKLSIQPAAMTRMFCFGDSRADIFLASLLEVESFSFEKGVLQLRLRDGGMMSFLMNK